MSAILVKSYVGQAEVYFDEELTNEREIYCSEKGTGAGHWMGKGAEALGLIGEIKKEDFSRTSRGVNPATDDRFRRLTLNRTREIGGKLTRVKEIAGWDMVISAPKSVSIVGLIGDDERVRAAHIESVADALERAERQAQANLGGGKKEQTGNLIVGRFSHDSARPSREGFIAPQLHDHSLIMNATLRADGALKPLESLELHRAQSYIKSVYYVGLADRLQKLGYAVEIDKETGAPEIAAISKKYRAACSPRRAEILALAEKAGKNFRQLGLVNRREKIFDKDLVREQHRAIDRLFDFQAARTVDAARENPRPAGNNSTRARAAEEVITFALAKLSERESVFNLRLVLLEANKRGIGKTNVVAIEVEFENRKRDGQIKTVRLRDGHEAAFLSADEKIERELPKRIKTVASKETLQDEILKTKIGEDSKAIVNTEFLKLSGEQQSTVKEILTAKSGVVTLEGRAGVEKTTTFSFMNRIAEKADYEVLGLAPTTSAARELENAKITISTLQKLLTAKVQPRERKRFFIVDESSFVSSRQMDKFFRDAVKQGDRVLLVGEMRRHEEVEAGKPFARTQQLAASAKIETSRGQKKEADCETVKNLSEGKIAEAVEAMRERGQVVEVKDRAARHRSIVEAFVAQPEKSSVVAPRNSDRKELNQKIHEALQDAGKVGSKETKIKILRPRTELSGVEREFAEAYRKGDVISYTRGSAENKINAKSLARVIKADKEQNLLTVEIKDAAGDKEARQITYNPKRLRGVSVWTEEKIKVSEGDRLQFRAPFETGRTKIANGALYAVGKITPAALMLTSDRGKAVKLDANQPHAIDYAYAVTSHGSQGKTTDRVLIHAETSESKQILNERLAYVAVSRARDQALIFTDDAAQLAGKMSRQIEKTKIARVEPKTIESVSTENDETKLPTITPVVVKSSKPKIRTQPAQEKTVIAVDVRKNHREALIKEVLQITRDSLAKQNIEPTLEDWKQFASAVVNDLPVRKASDAEKQHSESFQKNAPQAERVSLTGETSLEAIRALLKSAPEARRDEIVKDTLEKYEKRAAFERINAVKSPPALPTAENAPESEIEFKAAQEKTATGDESKDRRETLIREILQMSRNSLARQGVEPQTEAWRRFANAVIKKLPYAEPSEAQGRLLESLQKDAPPSGRAGINGKTRLEAMHAILTVAPEARRDELVKSAFAERDQPNIITEPEAEKNISARFKPVLKVRDFRRIEREKLIGDLVAAACDEARAWTGDDLTYNQTKRLTKMYREFGDVKPFDKQTSDLKALQDRFSEPLPQPKNFIEATVLRFDNLTDAEKSVALRGQLTKLNQLIEREENAAELGFNDRRNIQPYFIRQPVFDRQQNERELMTRMAEAYARNLVSPEANREQEQQAVEQMQIADVLREQIKRSLDEQGVKLQPAAQDILNSTVNVIINQPPTEKERFKVQSLAQSTGVLTDPKNRAEAFSYMFRHDEEARDRICFHLASKANEIVEGAEAEQIAAPNSRQELETKNDSIHYPQMGQSM